MLLDDLDLNNSAVLLVDLDKFKSINDIYGHDTGDKVLVKVSRVLLDYFGDSGHICRLGGDEFVILMENTTPAIQDQLKKKIYSTGRIVKNDMNEMKLDIVLHVMKELNISENRISKDDKYRLFEKIVFSLYPKATK